MTESSGSLGMKKGMERQETRIIKEHEEISEGFRFVHLHIRIPKFIKWYILNVNYILTNFFFFLQKYHSANSHLYTSLKGFYSELVSEDSSTTSQSI